jgi:hypothetical protein
MSGDRRQAKLAEDIRSMNTKGLPTFGNGVVAPRLVVFKSSISSH